ncbi:MAG: hypothetical protein M3R38_11480 [Actinomycetota bacterium]|jgi:hypothetical protein|nr:hypothetical protein [Actinomycetota bacterium]
MKRAHEDDLRWIARQHLWISKLSGVSALACAVGLCGAILTSRALPEPGEPELPQEAGRANLRRSIGVFQAAVVIFALAFIMFVAGALLLVPS